MNVGAHLARNACEVTRQLAGIGSPSTMDFGTKLQVIRLSQTIPPNLEKCKRSFVTSQTFLENCVHVELSTTDKSNFGKI